MPEKIIIVGAFHEIVELCESSGYAIVGFFDQEKKNDTFMGYPILGDDGDAEKLFAKYGNIPVVISPDACSARRRLYDHYSRCGYRFASLISKDAKISPSAKIGCGSVIQSGAYVSSNARIGKFVKVNVNATVMHDTIVGDFSTLAPCSVLLGAIQLGQDVYLGANATVLPRLKIHPNTVIGAGAVVTRDILEQKIVKGIPAK